MTTLTAEQVAGVVLGGGGPPSGTTAAQWIALARRESTFRTDVQDFLSSDHWGLWQIGATTHYAKYGTQYGSVENFRNALKGANANWNVARRLYMDSGWAPWRASGGTPVPSSADSRAAANPDSSIGGQGGGDPGEAIPVGVGDVLANPLGTISNVLQSVLDPILAASKWIGNPENWVRVIQVVGGIALGLVAASIVIKPVADEVVSTVGKVKPI